MGQGSELPKTGGLFLFSFFIMLCFVVFFFSLECVPEQLPGAALPFMLFKSTNITHYCKNIKNILELNA